MTFDLGKPSEAGATATLSLGEEAPPGQVQTKKNREECKGLEESRNNRPTQKTGEDFTENPNIKKKRERGHMVGGKGGVGLGGRSNGYVQLLSHWLFGVQLGLG